MPGYRIHMEDAICHHYPLTYGKDKTGQWGLFGVFDGHVHQGVVSEFISDHILHVLKQTEQYQSFRGGTSLMAQALNEACQNIDVDLRAWLEGQNKSVRKGGSTAVMAAITEEAIIFANVGDSRCILIQTKTKNNNTNHNYNDIDNDKSNFYDAPSLEDEMKNLDVTDDKEIDNGEHSEEHSYDSKDKERNETSVKNESDIQKNNVSIPDSSSSLVSVKAMLF